MSKVVFKMTFKHPNKPDTTSKNVSHVGYISTRSGVDKTLTESDLKKELEKGIENISSDDETYIQYIDERPKSHGLFGKDGIEDPSEVQEEISNVGSYVWRAIISIKEDDAKQIGYTDKEAWQNMLRANVSGMAEKMGIRQSNLRWVAAVHMEKGHPHTHVMFWEKEPEKTVGVVKPKVLDDIRKMYTDEIFEEERLQLINEKDLMRDLLRDLAKSDISKAARLVKEVKEAGQDIKTFIGITENEGVMPRLYSEEEQEIAEKIKHLGEIMPGKGRVALKFMPDDIKEEVRSIADYLLEQPEFSASLAKNLKAVEELTKMYTGKEEDIQKAKDNAYNDIRDRLSQVVLKGAAETQRKNIFYVDKEYSQNAVEFIKNLNNQINLIPEQTKILNEITVALVRTGHTEEQMNKYLSEFIDRENIKYSKESLEGLIKRTRDAAGDSEEINTLSSKKKIEYYLSVLKLSEYKENEAFGVIRETIKKDSQELDNKLKKLKDDGILEKVNEQYKLTDKGIEEFLKVKDLDNAEKEILKMLKIDGDTIPRVDFKELIDNKDVFSNLRNKDPEEFKLGRYDTKVRDEFGENNSLTLKELEERIYEKYTDEKLNINTDKADIEIELLEKRIEKLTLNGYVKFDRESGVYSFTDEVNEYFKYDEEKECYLYTDEAKEKLGIKGMEFTRYDAKVTLSYIDKAENSMLTEEDLRETLHKEIANQTVKRYYESFTAILESGQAKAYIDVSETGELTSTKEGQTLGREINKLNKYFYECKGNLTEEKLREICIRDFGIQDGEKRVADLMANIHKLIANGHIGYDMKNGTFNIDPITNDINKLMYQIYKEGGSINKDSLKEVLEKNIVNREAENQFKYLIKRLDNLKEQGYLDGKHKEYSLNSMGIEKREDLLTPQRELLREKMKYLERLGLVKKTEDGEYQATERYYSYMKNIAISKEEKTPRESNIITKDIAAIIDRTQDKVNVGKIERTNERIATGKYINGEYGNVKADYKSMRDYCNVQDTIQKTLGNLSKALIVSGMSLEETKGILYQWNINSNSNINIKKIDEILKESHDIVQENNLWGKTTIISTKEWKEMFGNLGVDEKDIPKWIYKGENWETLNRGVGLASLVNDLWKATWRELEKQRMQSQAQAEYMKKQMIKQQAASQNKGAIVEQIRKNKERGSMYRDDELEM